MSPSMQMYCNLPTTMILNQTKNKTKNMSIKIELEEEEEHDNKSLYICSREETQLGKSRNTSTAAFVIRAVDLSDLLGSSSSSPAPLRKVASYARPCLPESVGCGVLGSQIFFTGGVTPDGQAIPETEEEDTVYENGVYTFDTNVGDRLSIRKLDANLKGAKCEGLTTELCGKLYALSDCEFKNASLFEVFDPTLGTWEVLAQPPFFTPDSHYYFDDISHSASYSYLVVGTKIFVSNEESPVFCYDVARPERAWRMVFSMCSGSPFPFDNTALVLAIDGDDDNKKIVFAYTFDPWCLQVYLMSLRDNQETITEIGHFEIPDVPRQFGTVSSVELIHIGDNTACLAVTEFLRPEEITTKYYGVVIQFQYELDMTKDENSRLTLNFVPDFRCFEYDTDPTYPDLVESTGCFLL